ncbi:MAG: AAA family ATPase [Firmicutes bacterium]|nr:AAA family ATPase [Bacillota bacterium]
MTQTAITDNLDLLLEVLPPRIVKVINASPKKNELIEIVLDLGRPLELRYDSGLDYLEDTLVTREDLDYVTARVGSFGTDNRAGIERTLHRISAIRNRRGDIIGLTCRIGRAVYGTIDIVRDVMETGKSVLLLGRPGVGKTTLLRETARILATEFNKRVVIVDTSNEIAGDGDIPHPAIGRARRMQVRRVEDQAEVMIEAVENHMPEVIVIDEIGTQSEAEAARTIAERGVQLIGTAHGNTLDNLISNPTLSDLVGGIQAVTLGDEEAKRRGTQKTVLERKHPPTFDVVIEIQDRDRFAIHHDVAATVDLLLRGYDPQPEIRQRYPEGEIQVIQPATLLDDFRGERPEDNGKSRTQTGKGGNGKSRRFDFSTATLDRIIHIYPYGVSRNRLEKAISNLKAPVHIVKDLQVADVILTLKGQYRKMPKKLKEGAKRNLPIHPIRSNTVAQMEKYLQELMAEGIDEPLQEAEEAAKKVLMTKQPVALRPQNSYIRRLQHQLAASYSLSSESMGEEPNRHVVFYPGNLSDERM